MSAYHFVSGSLTFLWNWAGLYIVWPQSVIKSCSVQPVKRRKSGCFCFFHVGFSFNMLPFLLLERTIRQENGGVSTLKIFNTSIWSVDLKGKNCNLHHIQDCRKLTALATWHYLDWLLFVEFKSKFLLKLAGEINGRFTAPCW